MATIQVLKDPNDGGCGENSPFATYVERVREGVDRIGEDEFPLADGSTLTFACTSLIRTPDAPVPGGDWSTLPAAYELRLESPWLRIGIADGTPPRLHAVFHWNERQMLIDQAVLAGHPSDADWSNTPLTAEAYGAFVDDYEQSVLLAATPEDRDKAQDAVGHRMPADILWLLRNSWQSTRGPFRGFVDGARQQVGLAYLDGYARIALALFEECIKAPDGRVEYRTIADLSALVPIHTYGVNRMR